MTTDDTLTVEKLQRALDALGPPPTPLAIVKHPHIMAGKPWRVRDEGTDYYFVHPSDVDALPLLAPLRTALPVDGIRVWDIADPEMRAVWDRAMDRLVKGFRGEHQ